MSAADGHVVGHALLVDHGPAARRWNLVILAEGYRQVELPKFRTDCATFIDRLYAVEPYRSLWCALNIWCVDIASTDSGADEPATCADGGVGTGVTARTYLDATFCFAGLSRLLFGNEALALATAQAAVPQTHAVLVMVNSARYGGAGGGTAWFSLDPAAADIAIHELGHSAYHLDDEYTDLTGSWPAGGTTAPNLTTDTNRATTKWHDLIAASTPLPTMRNPNCAASDDRASPVAAGIVGLFEGGGRRPCGVWRAERDCFMRTLGTPFCAVCRRTIGTVLRPFMPQTLAAETGTQYSGTLPARATARLFTHGWPACWHVLWTVVPRDPDATPGADLRWTVQVERSTREQVTYWLEVTNLDAAPVEFEARYEILARA